MHNLVYVIGRLTNNVNVVKDENGKDVSGITVAVQRSYKNTEGIYETDFVDIRLHNGIAVNTAEYCKKGDLIGIRGRVETSINEIDGKKVKDTIVVADKITFLTSQKVKEKEDEIEMD